MPADQDVQSAGADTLRPGTEVGGYVVDSVIGTGGMGVVYGARHPRIGKRVAIKVLSPAFCGDPATVARFEQEARLVNEIGHPNIVDAFQFGELSDGRSFFVMELLEGESLGARLERGPLTVKETIEILDIMCDALEVAHEKGVIHRDLKSDNVFLASVRGKRIVKLLDFGLAKLAGRGEPEAINKTKSGIVVGTPAYMSPEQARGKEIDHRTDIYALGCLAYKMLTGKLPFVADNAMDLIVQQLHRPPPAPDKLARDTPAVLSRLVVQMMAKSADARPTLAVVRQVFRELGVKGERDVTKPKTRPKKSELPEKQRRSAAPVLIALSLALVAVIGVGVYAYTRHEEAPPASTAAPTPTTVAQPTPGKPSSPDPEIEMDPNPKPHGSAGPSAIPTPAQGPGSGSGSAHHHHHHGSATPAPDDNATDEPTDVGLPSVPKNAPGAILLTLDKQSRITIDGNVVAQDSRGGRFDVPPGHHTVEAKTAGRQAVTRVMDLDPGGTAIVNITFDTAPPSNDGSDDVPKP
jgi:serine/threonine protein kinase